MTLLQTLGLMAGVLILLPTTTAAKVRVENAAGNVSVRAITGTKLQVRHSTARGNVPVDATAIKQTEDLILVQSRPPKGMVVDLELELPHDLELEVETESGLIDLHGLFRRVDLISDRGDIRITTPWKAVSFSLAYEGEPQALSVAEELTLTRPISMGADLKKIRLGRRNNWHRLNNEVHSYPYSRVEVRISPRSDLRSG